MVPWQDPSPKPKPVSVVDYQPLSDPNELAAFVAMQAELERLQSALPEVACAIRKQGEEEDIELLLMSLGRMQVRQIRGRSERASGFALTMTQRLPPRATRSI
jgi:hypothetical protein